MNIDNFICIILHAHAMYVNLNCMLINLYFVLFALTLVAVSTVNLQFDSHLPSLVIHISTKLQMAFKIKILTSFYFFLFFKECIYMFSLNVLVLGLFYKHYYLYDNSVLFAVDT